MSILSGFRKQKRYATDEKGRHQLISTWTHTDTVYDDEGKSLTEIIEDLPAADKKVQQTATDSTNANYEILFSESADNVTKSEEARKSSRLLYNPGTKKLSLAESKLEVTGSNNGTTEVGGGSMTISRNNNLMEPQLSIYNEHSGGEALLRSNNIQIRDDYTSPTKVMEIQQEDIVLTGDTWDGTNTSLKTALANAGAKVLYGTSAPTSVQGEDGQLYVQLKTLDPYLDNFVVDYSASTQGGIDTELDISNLNECVIYIDQYQMVADVETLVGQYEEEVDFQNFSFLEITDDLGDVVLELGTSTGSDDLFVRKRNASDKFILSVVDADATADAIDKIYIKDNGEWLPDNDSTIPSPTSEDVDKVLGATDVGEYGWIDSIRFLDSGASAEVYTDHIGVSQAGYGGSSMTREQIQISNIMGSLIRMTSSDITLGGTWDGTNTSLKAAIAAAGGGTDEHAVHVPPVIFDNGELKKMSVDKFPGLEKVYLTPTAYSNLSTAQKEDLSKIYYVSDYEFHVDPDHPEVVVRVGNNNDVKWFFSGYTFANHNRYEVPESLRQYQPNNGTGRIRVDSTPYASASSTEPISSNYFVGWSNYDKVNQMRYSSITGSVSILDGTVYAVIDIAGGSGQTNPYSDPFDIPNGFIIYYGNKQYTDFDIPDPLPSVTSVDNGKVLKVVNGAWTAGADEGGSEAVYMTLEDYEALTTSEKEDPTKIYFVIDEGTKVSPTLNADDGNVEASSYFNNGSDTRGFPWHAFDGSIDTGSSSKMTSWNPWGSTGTEWISYSFDQMHAFSKVRVCSSMWGNSTFSGKYYVEGSNDGTTWANIMLQGEYVNISMTGQPDNSDIDILLDSSKKFSKIRLRIVDDVVEQFGNSKLFAVQEFEIYATDVVSTPKIYYKDILYNPLIKELPNTVVADAGKALIVNSEGEWDKGNIPRTNSVQVPPVIFDNNKLMKITDMTGFPELEKVFVTSEEYAQLTTAQKQDLSKIYYVSPYKFYTLKDGEITIRVNGTTYEWFFNGFTLTDNFYTIPSEYRQYTKNDPYEGSTAWSDNTSSTSLGIIEMGPSGYTERISAQDGNWGGNVILNTPLYGKVVIGNGDSQSNTYSDPYDVETPILIYYGGKQYTDYTMPSVYRELTQAEYDALPSSKNSDGIIYFITDNS